MNNAAKVFISIILGTIPMWIFALIGMTGRIPYIGDSGMIAGWLLCTAVAFLLVFTGIRHRDFSDPPPPKYKHQIDSSQWKGDPL